MSRAVSAVELKRARANPEIVEFLEDLLEKAKDGEIQGIAVATVHANRATGNGYSNACYDLYSIVGALRALEFTLLDEYHEKEE